MIGRNKDEITRINLLRAEMAQIPQNIGAIQNQIVAEQQAVAELQARIDAFEREQILPAQSTVDSLKARIAQLTLPNEIQALQTQIAGCDTSLDNLRSNMDSVMAQLAPINEEIGHLNSAIEITTAEEELIALRRNEQRARSRISELQANYRGLESEFNAANSLYRKEESLLSSLKYQQDVDTIFNHNPWAHHHHHHHHYDGYGYHYHDGSIMHTVGDLALSSDIYSQQETVNRLRRQVNDYQYRLQSVSNSIRSQEDDQRRMQTQIRLQEEVVKRNRLLLRNSDLSQSIVSLRNLKRIQEQMREPLENNRILVQQHLDSYNNEKKTLEAKLHLTNSELKRAEPLAKPFAEVNDVDDLRGRLGSSQLQLGGLQGTRAAMGGDIAVRLVSIERKRQQINTFKDRAANLECELLYPNAYDRFKELLQKMPNDAPSDMRKLYQYGWDLLHRIDEDEARAIKKNKPQSFDQASHADVLKACAAVLESRSSIDSIVKLDAAMNRSESSIHGQPSVSKKVLGGIMVFLGGAILIAGGSIMGVMVPFVSWPLSYVGIAAGAALLAGGIALIVSGRRKGADKALHQFRDQAPSAFKGTMFNPVVTTPLVQTEMMKPSAPPYYAVK